MYVLWWINAGSFVNEAVTCSQERKKKSNFHGDGFRIKLLDPAGCVCVCVCVGSRGFCFQGRISFHDHQFGSYVVVDYPSALCVCSALTPPLAPSLSVLPLFCPHSISLLTSVLHEYSTYSLFFFPSLSLLPLPPSLPPEVRSDTVPGRGAERCADVAVESRGDQPGPGAAVRLHLRSVRPAAIHLILAQRRRDEGPAAPGPAPGPGQPQRGRPLALLPEDRPRLQQDAAAHQRWRRGPERVGV